MNRWKKLQKDKKKGENKAKEKTFRIAYKIFGKMHCCIQEYITAGQEKIKKKKKRKKKKRWKMNAWMNERKNKQ